MSFKHKNSYEYKEKFIKFLLCEECEIKTENPTWKEKRFFYLCAIAGTKGTLNQPKITKQYGFFLVDYNLIIAIKPLWFLIQML